MESQMDIVTETFISWEEAATCISGGTVESLSRLRRSEAGLKSYRAFKEQVLQEWATVLDHIKPQLFECVITVGADGRKSSEFCRDVVLQQQQSQMPGSAGPAVAWKRNDFPYNLESGIEHHVLWSPSGPLRDEAIQEEIAAWLLALPPAAADNVGHGSHYYETQWWVNPPELQSIRACWHAHVLLRRMERN